MTNRNISADPIRRHYNQWVNNEMLEDCALRFTAIKNRRWSCFQVANTALGSISFLALEAIGAAITLHYGWVNAAIAIAVVGTIIFLLSVPVAVHAAKAGVDVDLLTRGAGFGYLGSTITSLIYAGFTFIYFALEAAIMATALQVCFGIPLSLGYLLCSLAVIPAVIYGITMISRIQRYTQHLWLIMQLAPFLFLAWQSIDPMEGWQGIGIPAMAGTKAFDWVMFGAASAVVFSLVVQIGEQVDYLRFLPVKTPSNSRSWWIALIAAGPGWIVIGVIKMFAGAYLCLLAVHQGLDNSDAVDPVHLYLNAWANWVTPELALAVTGAFVILCQFKINITNSYAGSIAWSNFFSRLTHSHPGRVVWLVFNVTIALMLMELGVYKSLENTLSLYSILGVSWIGAIAADLAINKTLGLSPPGIGFKRAELYDINPVGVFSMAISTGVGFLAHSGYWGIFAESMATYIALACVLCLVPLLAWLTAGRYYLTEDALEAQPAQLDGQDLRSCVICRSTYDNEDLVHCPAYQGRICSLCCSLDTRCEDQCRPSAPFLAQLRQWTRRVIPQRSSTHTYWIVLQFICLVLVAAAVVAFIFGLVYLQSGISKSVSSGAFANFTQNLFAALLVLTAIVTWMFLLASETARRAREETVHQNELLQREITAHELTEMALRKAREKAEAANEAKSRYVIGLSHELRTPLNSILGYAQLMEQDTDLPDHRRNGVRVIRDSAQHLSGLIGNLLDISRIEADRLSIHRDPVSLHEFLNQLTQMFQIQAEFNRLEFKVSISSHVPRRVIADEKRLRQILINLLSNAFKYTQEGHVELVVDYRSQVTTFKVCDTGIGISKTDLKKIYLPFETLPDNNPETPKGTGLGLTISRLLAEIMGGDLTVNSTPGEGSCFTLKLLLPPINNELPQAGKLPDIQKRLATEKTIVVVDDDENHRMLVADFLQPLGFKVLGFANAKACIDAFHSLKADVFLLDISMPGMSGWDLAEQIRMHCEAPVRILMISALVDDQVHPHVHDASRKNYFVKPLDLQKLFLRLQEILVLEYVEGGVKITQSKKTDYKVLDSVSQLTDIGADSVNSASTQKSIADTNKNVYVPGDLLEKINGLYTIGHISAINEVLRYASTNYPGSEGFVKNAKYLLDRHQIDAFGSLLRVSNERYVE
ncbi:MAG: response regulator [Granulosicoccus sp.]|nr:response regulator [Granulosicoccus sp.]